MDHFSKKAAIFGAIALVGNVASTAFAVSTAPSAPASEFDYPELMVAPRASERIEREAKEEGDRRFTTYLPTQLSAASTLAAGFIQLGNTDVSKDPDKGAAIAGIAVGGGWLALTGVLMATYHPYTSALGEIGEKPKDQRGQLVRERRAEEDLKHARKIGRILTWLSTLSNLGVNVYMTTKATGSSFGQVTDAIAAGMSLAPLFFGFHWGDVAHEQEDYKKRIYAPVAAATVFAEPGTGRVAPGMALAFRF